MSDITIVRVRDGDLAGILRNFERFWGDLEFPAPCITRCSSASSATPPSRPR